MKVYLFNDSRSQNNWGCRATTLALRRLIEESGHTLVGAYSLGRATRLEVSTKAEAAKRLLDLAPPVRTSVRQVMWARERKRGIKSGRVWKLADFEPLAQEILAGRAWEMDLPILRDADVFIVNGEGSIYGQEQKGLMTLFFCYFVVRHLGKPCALVNHTADLSDPIMAEAAAVVYPMLTDVLFREPISARKWASLAPQVPDSYAPDAAFTDEPRLGDAWIADVTRPGALDIWPYTSDGFDPRSPYVCLLGSSALARPESGEGFPMEAFSTIAEGLGKRGAQVFIVASDSTDEAPMAKVARALNRPFLPANTPLPIAMDVLANASCLVGGRWHPAILGARGGAPSVMFSANTTKTTALLEMLGLSGETFDVAHLAESSGAITDAVCDYLNDAEIKTKVRDRAATLALEARKNIRILSA